MKMSNATVTSLELCGISNAGVIFNGNTQTERISAEVFDNDLRTCMDKSIASLEDNWETFSSFTINQGQIRLRPGVKKSIRALNQWARDEISMERNPNDTAFPIVRVADLIQRNTTHDKWVKKSFDMTKVVKPNQFLIRLSRWTGRTLLSTSFVLSRVEMKFL